jgi:hypothetical protein
MSKINSKDGAARVLAWTKNRQGVHLARGYLLSLIEKAKIDHDSCAAEALETLLASLDVFGANVLAAQRYLSADYSLQKFWNGFESSEYLYSYAVKAFDKQSTAEMVGALFAEGSSH